MQPPPTILLVDDEELVRNLGHRYLAREGYEVLAARSSAQALRIGEEWAGPIDLLLTDVTMPGVNGYELATRLRARRPGLPVVYMSGYVDERVAAQSRAAGPLVQKPFALAVLRDAIEAALVERRAA